MIALEYLQLKFTTQFFHEIIGIYSKIYWLKKNQKCLCDFMFYSGCIVLKLCIIFLQVITMG